jgi:hypothetical protein
MTLSFDEQASPNSVFPKHNIQLLGVLQYILVITLRLEVLVEKA